MPRFKNYDYNQMVMVPVDFSQQILPGTFEYSLHFLVDNELDLSIFDSRFRNDETGRRAYDPAILLKIVLLAYSRGITSNRKIEAMCRENVVLKKHREEDRKGPPAETIRQREEKQKSTLEEASRKVRKFLTKNKEREGRSGKEVQSNITDNESAKMKTSHSVIQGDTGVAAVDGKHQVVVAAEAFGAGQEHGLLKPMIEGVCEAFNGDYRRRGEG